MTLDDAFDLTPELKAAARQELQKYQTRTACSRRRRFAARVQRPGMIGGANWGGGAFDPKSGVLFLKTTNQANIMRVGQAGPFGGEPARV